MLQIGDANDPEKKYASIPSGKTIETITLEEALEAFVLPRNL
jgi:DNA topoisomerase-1